ncbi:MAG: EAL domain-containing protein [Alphaproteobacteria bacterium]|nr:MAG: EAL domain-containing protein [Alphaproteobacteria bacterium]
MYFSTRTDDSLAQPHRLRAAIEASGDLLYCWDLATDRIEWIGALAQFFGPERTAVPQCGDDFNGRINPEDLPLRMQALSEHFAGAQSYDCEYRIRAGNGEFHWVHDRGTVELSPSGTPARLAGVLRLITQRKLQQAHLEQLANYDELTGHFNKLRLREALDDALTHSLRYGRHGAFLVVGVDQLDHINTAYGYEAGDTVLVAVAQCLDRCLRATDVIGRLGSDRFGVLLNPCCETEAAAIGERILHTLRQETITLARNTHLHVTASIGLVCFPKQARTSFDAIAKAEGALLKAKAAGRDCLYVYHLSEEQCRTFRASMKIGEQVTRALKDDRLVFAYQPVVDARTHEVRYYECLLRMYDEDGTLIPASKFVPVVERIGLVRALDRCTLDMALRDLEAHPGIVLAVNISGATAADRGWLRTLVTRLKERSDLASRLIVEITETAALHDIDDTARFVSVVRDLGCQVAIDDFGAGYTTFRHLRALTVDIVKIDGSFVRHLETHAENLLFIRNLLALAKSFNLITVGEGVETEAEAALLLAEGIDLLQGYSFGYPDLKPAWRTPATNGKAAVAPAVSVAGNGHCAVIAMPPAPARA